ncbi:MAG TPA: hypothetical protein DCS83_01645 [Prevotella sp.]|nr:hypothetical protein [Prevotella sp.]
MTKVYHLGLSILLAVAMSSCSEDLYNENSNVSLGKISTMTSVKEASNSSVSSRASKDAAPPMSTRRMTGAKGNMYLRFTAAAGITATKFAEAKASTRGRSVSTDNFHDDYAQYMYKYDASLKWKDADSITKPWIINEQILKDRAWSSNELWPGSSVNLAFICYAPYGANGLSSAPTATSNGRPIVHYTVPTTAETQQDLLVDTTYDVPGDYNQAKSLNFKHALTAIRFAVGDQMAPCSITKIAINGVYGAADFNYHTMSWQNVSATKYSYTLTTPLEVKSTDKNKVLNDGNNTFFMMPQTVPSGAQIIITLSDGGTHTLTADISNHDWKPGYTVTYYLSTATVNDDYILSLSTSSNQVSGNGGTAKYSVQSYKQTFYGSQVPVPWTASYTVGSDTKENTTLSDPLTAFTFSDNGGTTATAYTMTFNSALPLSDSINNVHTVALRAKTKVSKMDLAKGNTANCYVVSAPGTYTFPLVYGNALKNDSVNTVAFTSTSSSFIDHKGNKITQPYIYKNYDPFDAILIWQDAPNLITPASVQLTGDKHSIQFEIEKNNICQGNAVIAVRDYNLDIMWSWHIWVTDCDITKTVTMKAASTINKFMPVPLGFCNAETRSSQNSSTYHIKVAQTEGTKTASTDITLGSTTLVLGNSAPFYEWGRKDPLRIYIGNANTSKPIYNTTYNVNTIYSVADIKTSILEPFAWNISIGTTSPDLWNAGNTVSTVNANKTIKTVYDPCPVGFTLPCTAAFQDWNTRTTVTGGAGITGFIIASVNNQVSGPTLFVPALGDGYWDTYYGVYRIANVGGYAYYWTAGPSDINNGRDFVCGSSGDYYTVHGDYKTDLFGIFPVSETF